MKASVLRPTPTPKITSSNSLRSGCSRSWAGRRCRLTPNKKHDKVQIKRAGNFGKLVVVKISDDFQFAARMVDRGLLVKGKDKFVTLLWESMVAGEKDQEIHKNFPIKKVLAKRKGELRRSPA